MATKPKHPLTAFREKFDLSMTELANMCQCRQQYIDRIEKLGTIPRAKLMRRIFAATNALRSPVTPNDLYGVDGWSTEDDGETS